MFSIETTTRTELMATWPHDDETFNNFLQCSTCDARTFAFYFPSSSLSLFLSFKKKLIHLSLYPPAPPPFGLRRVIVVL